MKRTFFLFAALVLAGGTLFAQTEAPAAKEVAFKARPHKKGDKIAFSGKQDTTFQMTISVMEQTQEQSQEQKTSIAYFLEVLEVDKAGLVTKVKGKINKWEKAEKAVMPMMGENETGLSDAQTSLIGKDFILDTSSSPATVTDAEGTALPSEQAAALREELLDAAGRIESLHNELEGVIPAKTRIGDTIKLDGKQVAKLIGADEEESAEQLGDPADIFSGTLKLKEVRSVLGNEVGVFDVLFNMDADVQGMAKIKSEPKGELHVGLNDKYVYKVDITGRMTVNGSQMMPGPDGEEIEITMNGGGGMTMNMQALYSNAK